MRLVVCLLVVCTLAAAQIPPSSHIWIITEENHSYEEVIGNSNMPYFNNLAAQYGLATQSYSPQHNSLSALMWLVAGQKVTDDDNAQTCFDVNNVVRQLLARNFTWKAYQEDLPYPGFQGLSYANYVRRHNPLIDFTDTCDPAQMYNSVPYTQLATDITQKQTPNLAYITPNLQHDAHDGPLANADAWLAANVPTLLALPEFQPGGDGLLFIAWDEGGLSGDNRCSSQLKEGCGGRVANLLIGPQVKPGYQSATLYSHPNLLHTVCEAMQLGDCPMEGAVFASMSDFFNTVQIAAPFPAATVVSPVAVKATTSGTPVYAMQVYVDDQLAYHESANQIDTAISMSAGKHHLVVQSWDTAGGIHKRGVYVNVQGQAVVVSSPAPGAVLGSPVSFQATAQGGGFNSMSLLVDGIQVYQIAGSTLSTRLKLSKGQHNVVIEGITGNGEVSSSFSLQVVGNTIKIVSPKPAATLYSPIPLEVTATSPPGISAMQVYVDSRLTYEATGWGFNFPLSVPGAGLHSIVIQSSDQAGNVKTKAVNVNILPVNVTITTPTQNEIVTSPVAIQASADGPNVYAMQVYVDNALKYTTNGKIVNTSLSMASGPHYLVVKAWDTGGGTWTSSVNITVP
jgi:phosphatidylinositol-3-phosphatase